jgi:pimeloyl-ACP methyl ester carboxylesterase
LIQSFDSDGVPIAFVDEGEGLPVLLIHGFASNRRVNWVSTSWVRDLTAAGRRVLTFDNRGHGESGKPHESAAYHAALLARDAERLLDHVGIERADVVGYSMGARISAFLALESPERVRRAVLSGIGEGLVKPRGPTPEAIAAALLAASPDDIPDERARAFRTFADQTGSDREALAACILGCRQMLTPEELAGISQPVLVAAGAEDEVAGDPQMLAALIPGAEVFSVPSRDHMKAVGDRAHKTSVLAFLERQP